ncbi:hypothetical protein [Campylobacter lari]|uniref:hypothetical protein n=1 Tax=Campylobacter lari TaxID=201 RepID=UPI001271E4F5|nr:hypothetical protein [Campylobacter lari]EAL5740504.1 hypothetical protein [Campylobacter lari]MCR6518825.1 hypothetical protein [Campylobacter lari]MCR6528923.1 hypothetical protein [Campylobacter lari]MCR6540970.1 hypothetical protein [Campylobacter lari]
MEIFFVFTYHMDFIYEIDLFSFIYNDFIQSANYKSGGNISKLDSLFGVIASALTKLIFCIVVVVIILSYILEKLHSKS